MATQTTTTTEHENIALSTLRLTSHGNASKAIIPDRSHEHLESNRNAAPVNSVLSEPEPPGGPVDIRKTTRRDYIQFAALCFCLFLAGWNDGEFPFCCSLETFAS